MFRSEWKVLTDALSIGNKYELESMDSLSDLTTFLHYSEAGIVLVSLRDKNDLIQLATLVKSLKKTIPHIFVKILVVNFSGNAQFDKAVGKLDLDLLQVGISPKAMSFKIDFAMKSINAQLKNKPQADSPKNVKTLENVKNQDKKIAEGIAKWADPIDCEDDIWLLRNETDCKKVLTRWLVRFMGPSPYVATWVESGTPGVWKFEFKKSGSIFISGQGSWFFRGDQKPDFIWAENVWSFTGSAFELFYKQDQQTFSRLCLKDKQITIAKTSEYAKTKEKIIVESLDKDLVFKKELIADAEKKAFENEQDNFKNLEGKNKTDSINLDPLTGKIKDNDEVNTNPLTGKSKTDSINLDPLTGKIKDQDEVNTSPLSGKSKTDNIQQEPLSGEGKTSNIVNNPLSLNLKPNENSISQDPHAQKTETSKSSSHWKGKNEYQKENENGELTAPVDNVINPGAELSMEAKNAHSTFYKNHNQAETFEPKDVGHSITKDGVSGNLKGKTDPHKASSAAGGSDLGGKTSTDQLEKHMSSPDGRLEKIAKEKKAGDLGGKSSTDKLEAHMSTLNEKKNKSIAENGELAGKSSTDKLKAHLSTLNEKKDKSIAEKNGNGALAGKTSTEKLPSHFSSPESKKNRTTTNEIDELTNELNDNAEDRKVEKQLASLKLRKEKLEKYKKDKAEAAANDKASDDKTNDNVSKLPLPKAKPKQTGELIDNEISGKVIPFTEKQKFALTESLGRETKEIENSVRPATVTSILVQDAIKFQCTLDDFFEQTIIFETLQSGIVKSKEIVLDLNFNYMDKNTSLVFNGKVVEVETYGTSNYITIEISSQNSSDFDAFMKLYNTRQENINFFLNAAKG
jgi:hypothetical protein